MRKLGLSPPALIIASASPRKLLESVWIETFKAVDFAFDVLPFSGECSLEEIARGKQKATQMGARCVVGVGGGKALDTARAVASELALPVVCCPTTAASDAPCSALSIVYTEAGVFEKCLFYKRNPDLVLVDSSVIIRAPVRYLIAGMGDALATWFEADTAQRAHKPNAMGGASTIAAAALSALCYRTLLNDGRAAVAAAHAGAITPAFERIVEANTLLSGLGFESGGLAVAHSVHNGLTAAPETHAYLHGEKVAFGTLVQLVLEGRDSAQVEEVMQFCHAVGLPITLQALGIAALTRDTARAIATRATAIGETAHNEPFVVTVDAVMDALYAADAWGQAFQSAQ
jgi:glycerol dehydrogenase